MSHAEHENINHSHDPRQHPLGPGQTGRRGVMGFICEQENEVDKGSDSPVNERFQGDDDGRDLNPCLQISVEIRCASTTSGDRAVTFCSGDIGSIPATRFQGDDDGRNLNPCLQISVEIRCASTTSGDIAVTFCSGDIGDIAVTFCSGDIGDRAVTFCSGDIGSIPATRFQGDDDGRDLNPCLQISVEIR
ncbi:unnamed protein product [Boreogadus saida]